MAIDPRYIPAFSLEDVFVDKDTGAPLAGGKVYFYRDSQPNDPKFVYQITGTDPNYSYIALPNPMILSSIGTFEDSLGNPVVPYFLPFIGVDDDPDYYLVRVYNANDVPQFDRRPVPYIGDSSIPSSNVSTFSNQLSNPQFEEVLFDTSSGNFVYSFSAGADQVQAIAPDWDIIVTCAGTATVTVRQVIEAGTTNVPTNPGALLEISSAGVTNLKLRQRLYGSPNLWGNNSYLSGTFTGRSATATALTMTMYYSQSDGTVVDQEIATGQFLADGSYITIKGNILLDLSDNTQSYPDAWVDIYIDIPVSQTLQITSIMVAGTGNSPVSAIVYEQTSTNRQIDQLFHYYKPQLEYKPIPSYLIGWDFHLNPAQFYGDSGNFATPALGANKSRYIWDQTIGFQTTANSLNFSRDTDTGGLKLGIEAAAANGKIAIVQYLEANQAREILSQRNALQLRAKVSSGTLNGSLSLFWTDDVSLPVLTAGTDNSLVSAITGVIPTAGHGTWTAVPNTNLGNNALFTLTTSYQTFDFVGFDASATAAPTSATFMAVVIVFDTLTNPDEIVLQYCSLNGGDIATRPAPQTKDEVLARCEYYLEKSYNTANAVGANTSGGMIIEPMLINVVDGGIAANINLYAQAFNINFKNVKRFAPTLGTSLKIYTVTGTADRFFSLLQNNGATVTSNPALVFSTYFALGAIGIKSASFTQNSTTVLLSGVAIPVAANGYMQFHYVIDERLGLF